LLWQRLWRRPIVKRVFYEILGLVLMRRRGLEMLNCGYSEAGYPHIPLKPESEGERLGFQLYHRLVRSASLAGADLIEIGCGRGGGARFLAGQFGPRSYWATDFSRLFTFTNRLSHRPMSLRFRFARAERLPFQAGSFDLGLSVEAMHPLPDKAACLKEMARVLRPGGRLLIADFFYARDSSPSALTRFRRTVGESAFKVDTEEDWTPHVLEALEADTPRRLAEIRKLPRVFHKLATSFASTSVSPIYHQLRDGRATYVHFELSLRNDQLGRS
jgi:ubiquinone/menaquinone biosynthesis C-methylase UbiE